MKNNRRYLIACTVTFLVMVTALVVGPDKGAMHLWLNGCHTPLLDGFFRGYTWLAQWPLYAVMACCLFYRYSWTIYYALSEILSACVVQLIKAFVNMPRPATFFGEDPAFQQIVVDGVHLHHWHSFPSGHTATFFVFFTVLAFLLMYRATQKNASNNATPKQERTGRVLSLLLAIVLLFLALLGGYSRIYLSQHFLMDVTAGMLIGTLSPCLLWPLFLRLDARLNGASLLTTFSHKRS